MILKITIAILLLKITQALDSSFTVVLSSSTVNAISSYTWTVNFNSTVARDPLIF